MGVLCEHYPYMMCHLHHQVMGMCWVHLMCIGTQVLMRRVHMTHDPWVCCMR